MAMKSLRILCQTDFPTKTIRVWDGSGPYLDQDGQVWAGAVLNDGLDQIECAINGEASTLTLSLSGVDPATADIAFSDLQAGHVIGSVVQLLIQSCDQWDQPVGAPKVRFTGTVDNLVLEDTVIGDQAVSAVLVEVTNRFALRSLVNGAVLSDVDHRERSKRLNPSAPPDQFCERIAGLADKTIRWPRYT